MKKTSYFTGKFKNLCFFLIFLFVFIIQTNFKIIKVFAMENYQNKFVTEELRLKVPANFKKEWFEAEKNIWAPWLSSQDGFLGRQIFWNKEKEEALILVKWEDRKLWKNIPTQEVNEIQGKFEESVKKALKLEKNPFELIYEGELDNQE